MKQFYSSIMKILVSIFILQFIITSANAQWSTDPTVNNSVLPNFFNGGEPKMTSDGSGGVIISILKVQDIYAQRVDANGIVQWTSGPVPICVNPEIQTYQQIISDGAGGAIITWQDWRSTSQYDIFAQRIDANGVVQWTSNGVAICTSQLSAGDGHITPKIISDGDGGAIIIWQNYFVGVGTDIYAQRINGSGTVLWTANGVEICTAALNQNDPQLCSDGANGAIITWGDDRPTFNGDIYAQRIGANGVVQWAANGIAICTSTGQQRYPQICSDGASGAIITWNDAFQGNDDVFVQRINSTGATQWSTNGVAICTATSLQPHPQISSDGSGGAIIAWYDYRNGTSNADIYAQRINANGAIQYTAGGLAICTATGHQYGPQIINDGALGAIITWYDYRVSTLNSNIYAQRTNESGVAQWTANGAAICTNLAAQGPPQITSAGSGDAIIAWGDGRGGINNGGIYAQRVGVNGVLGNITTGVEEQAAGIHNLFLSQNYPNPFKQSTKIRYETDTRQLVLLKVSDLSGKVIKTLVNEEQPAGSYEVEFDGSKIASGTYIIELQAGILKETQKMILMK